MSETRLNRASSRSWVPTARPSSSISDTCWTEFRFAEIARKVVGVGSVGTQAWIVLMLGIDEHDPLILQAKEADESVIERFAGKSRYASHGQRVVAGQRLMQATSDIFLGLGPDDRARWNAP